MTIDEAVKQLCEAPSCLSKSKAREILKAYGKEQLARHRVVLLDKMEELMNYARQNKKDYETVNEAHFSVAQIKECLNNLK